MSINDKAGRPWSPVLGLMTGCGVAVMCVYRDLDPDVIVFRAVISGFVCGVAVSITRCIVRFFQA
jgi:hypothetical protein